MGCLWTLVIYVVGNILMFNLQFMVITNVFGVALRMYFMFFFSWMFLVLLGETTCFLDIFSIAWGKYLFPGGFLCCLQKVLVSMFLFFLDVLGKYLFPGCFYFFLQKVLVSWMFLQKVHWPALCPHTLFITFKSFSLRFL